MNDLFLRACRGEPVARTPIWIMRQAGRYLPEYRAVREKVDFLTLCRTPELAAQVTLQPVDRFGVDAAILFSDLLTPAEALGLEIRFEPGPVVTNPLRTEEAIRALPGADPEAGVPYVFETIRILRKALADRVPLIGFCGAPFTLAAYLVEGRGHRLFPVWKSMLLQRPDLAEKLMSRLTEMLGRFLAAQVRAGVQAVQVFDTWAGLLDRRTYQRQVLPHVRALLASVRSLGVPRIYFGVNTGHLLETLAGLDAEVIGVDWRTGLDEAAQRTGGRHALQGNLDPCALLTSTATVRREAKRVLDEGRHAPGHVFNLGHGILPETPVEHVEALVAEVQGR